MTVDADTLGDRIKHALSIYAARSGHGGMSHADLGEAIAAAQGVSRQYSADDVFAWMSNDTVPPLSTLLAIGELARFTAPAQLGRLAYGREFSIHGLNDADYRRFHRLS